MTTLVKIDLGETFQFKQHEFTKKKTFEFARKHGFTGKVLIYGHKTRLYTWCKKCAFLGRFHNLEEFHEFL